MLIFQDDLADFWKRALSLESIISFIILNESPFAYHLWYIGAFLYVLFVFNILICKHKIKSLIAYMPLLLILAFVLGVYSKLFFKQAFAQLHNGRIPFICNRLHAADRFEREASS